MVIFTVLNPPPAQNPFIENKYLSDLRREKRDEKRK